MNRMAMAPGECRAPTAVPLVLRPPCSRRQRSRRAGRLVRTAMVATIAASRAKCAAPRGQAQQSSGPRRGRRSRSRQAAVGCRVPSPGRHGRRPRSSPNHDPSKGNRAAVRCRVLPQRASHQVARPQVPRVAEAERSRLVVVVVVAVRNPRAVVEASPRVVEEERARRSKRSTESGQPIPPGWPLFFPSVLWRARGIGR
jgi:hypothetical protein